MNNTKWLASVQSLDEAISLNDCLPDIVDMKQPASGALGALSTAEVRNIVEWIDGRCLTSATVGDLPMQAAIISPALQSMAATGVDYVKLGLFGGSGQAECLAQLQTTVNTLHVPVIAVLFADSEVDFSVLTSLKQIGFKGVMVDTATKNGQSLLDCWDTARLTEFVKQAKALNLLCGLAGALRIEDIATLKPLQAEYIGFRSALCLDRQRNQLLQPALARKIHQLLIEPLELVS